MVAAAFDAGCARRNSEYLRHRQVIAGRLTIENPFR
jgi:predicted nucleic acid-binding protein